MRSRLIALRTGVLGVAVWGVIALVVLGGGYLLSDLLYDAGLWPMGAVLRVLLIGALLWFAWVILVDVILNLIRGLIYGDPFERELERITSDPLAPLKTPKH